MNPRFLQILIAILALGILGFGGYQTLKTLYKPAAPVKTITLNDYLTKDDVQVRLTIIGPVTAPEKHVEQTFTVSSSSRDLSVAKAYNTTPAYTNTYDNNQAAFNDFMKALQTAGFTAGAATTSKTTEVGNCPVGTRAVYELISGGTNVFRTWSSSCGSGTFQGSASAIKNLFQVQFPDFNRQLTPDLRL